MSGAMGLDIRLPIGGLFALLGLLLTGYGVVTADNEALYVRSLSVNVNLWWGLVMLVFGLLLLFAAARGRRGATARPASETPEGRALESLEHRSGLEH